MKLEVFCCCAIANLVSVMHTANHLFFSYDRLVHPILMAERSTLYGLNMMRSSCDLLIQRSWLNVNAVQLEHDEVIMRFRFMVTR
jgi:hypothetical protein